MITLTLLLAEFVTTFFLFLVAAAFGGLHIPELWGSTSWTFVGVVVLFLIANIITGVPIGLVIAKKGHSIREDIVVADIINWFVAPVAMLFLFAGKAWVPDFGYFSYLLVGAGTSIFGWWMEAKI